MRNLSMTSAVLLFAVQARADPFQQVGPTRQGRVQFVLVGASLVDNQGLNNGVNCYWPNATAIVRDSDLPLRPTLKSATLYVGGSLLSDDGPDYTNPDVEVFTTPGLSADNPTQLPAVEAAARDAADTSVEFQPPGATAPVTVNGTPGTSYVTAYFRSGEGNIAFFMTPIDVTDVIVDQGHGVLDGGYTVSGLQADVCLGREVLCIDPPNAPTCGSEDDSAIHTNGALSFALLLVVEDPELPLHSIAIFEGMTALQWSNQNIRLQTASAISDPAAGALAFYALEGDLLISAPSGAGTPCDVAEYIEVDGDANPNQDGLCLVDDDNPLGNIFNSTINVQPQSATPPPCTGDVEECCGDGLCPVTGVDIDRFNISEALLPGQSEVRATVASGGDRVALGLVVLGVDVFEPLLAADSQIRVIEERPWIIRDQAGLKTQVGHSLEYSIAVSNTGNVSATDVAVQFSLPALASGASVLIKPPDATHEEILTAGGAFGNGSVTVGGFAVAAGEIAEVRLSLRPGCPPNRVSYAILPQATVTASGLPDFDMVAPAVEVHGSTDQDPDPCPGFAPGPFGVVPPGRDLRGGGGCRSIPALAGGVLLALVIAWVTRRRPWMAVLLLVVSLLGHGCGERRQSGNGPPPPAPENVTSLEGLPGEECGGPLMVWITRADDSRFCIDRFEAALDSGTLGDAHQGSDDQDMSLNGSTLAKATVALNVEPATQVSWYQARAACENAGKRLCTLAEWELACRGPSAWIYPYGDAIDDSACNGFFRFPEEKPEQTGDLKSCASVWGAFDISGNVEEWVLDAVPRIPGMTELRDRVIRGGSFKSNSNALACIGDEFHAAPGSTDIDRGFRCCSDGPL